MNNTFKHRAKPYKEPRETSLVFVSTFAILIAVLGYLFVAKAIPQMQLDRACAVEVCG